MPNYSLIANTQFKARSFKDLIEPYTMYTKDYREQEDALSELATKADVWKGLANEQLDPITYAQYTNYANALQEQAKVIADRGLNPSSRQEMLNLKRRYSSEITPIEQAYAARKAQAEEQRKALLSNPTLLLSRKAEATSLDKYLDNTTLGYDAYSGALLTQQVGQAAANLAKELRDYGNGKALDSFTKTWTQKHGFTSAEVLAAINNPNDPKSSSVLNTLVNDVVNGSGILNWADNKTASQAYSYARQGLWQAIGQTAVTPYANKAAEYAAQEAIQRRSDARHAAMAAQQQQQQQPTLTGEIPVNYSPLYTPQQIAAYKNYSKYFYKDKKGGIRLNDVGYRIYKNGITLHTSNYGDITNYDFRNFINNLNGGKSVGGPGQIGNLWHKYLHQKDAYQSPEYKYSVSSTNQNSLKDNVLNAIGTNNLSRVEFNGKTFISNGTLSAKDLAGSKYKITEIRFSPYGNTMMIQGPKGAERYNLPAGINSTNQNNLRNSMNYLKVLQKAVASSKNSKSVTISIPTDYASAYGIPSNRRKITCTPEQLQQEIKNVISQAYMFTSQLLLTNTTSSQNYSPYSY